MNELKEAVIEMLEKKGAMFPESIRAKLKNKFKKIGLPSDFYHLMWQLEQDGKVLYRRAEVITNGYKESRNYYKLNETEGSQS